MLTRLLFTHIMETKTLEIDKPLYEEAQRYASSKGTDLRTLVETFLRSLPKNEGEDGGDYKSSPFFIVSYYTLNYFLLLHASRKCCDIYNRRACGI